MSRTTRFTLLAALPAALLALAATAQSTPGTPATHPAPFQHLLQKLDTNGDGRISEQEFLAAASTRFAALDSAHTGRLDAQAMLASPQASARLQRHAAAMVRRLDTVGNGDITRDEVAAAAQTRFARLDRNGDGKLTPDELAQARHAGAENAANPRRAHFAQQRFDRLDTNHDGVVTQDEFVAAAVARFEKLDTQGSGRLTAAQIVAAPATQQRAARAVERRIRHLDSNGDGFVSQDEFLAAAKKRFARLDRNGDGFIDAGELPAARWPRGGKGRVNEG